MRMKAESSGIIFLLLMGYAHSSHICEKDTVIGNLSHGKILPRSAFTTRFQVSLYHCATECWLRKQRCKSFNYRRIYPSCQLCEEDSGPGGINLQPEHNSIHSNIDTWKNINMGNCSALTCKWTQRCDPFNPSGSTCVPSECRLLEILPGVTIDPSNETSVGTHVWWRFELGRLEGIYHITTCLESTAQWSTTNFTCALCDTEYKIVTFGGSYFCIKFHDIKTTFNKTMEICKSENAKLLVFTSADEIRDVQKAFKQKRGKVFAGISDETEEGTWSSWFGRKVMPVWNPNEPNGKTNENCGVHDLDYNVIGLLDVSCNDSCSFLCYRK